MSRLAVAALTALLVVLIAFHRRPDTGRRVRPVGDVDRAGADHHRLASFRSQRAERRPPSARAVAEWCDDLARQIRSGTSLTNALAASLPNDPATRRATDELRRRLDRGRSLIAAVESAPVSDEGPSLRLALGVIATAAQLGGSPAAAIDRTAGTLRQRAADHDERSVHAAQARLSANVLTVVPIAMLLLLLVTDSDIRDAAASTLGACCIALGLTLNAFGSIWMRRLVGPRS